MANQHKRTDRVCHLLTESLADRDIIHHIEQDVPYLHKRPGRRVYRLTGLCLRFHWNHLYIQIYVLQLLFGTVLQRQYTGDKKLRTKVAQVCPALFFPGTAYHLLRLHIRKICI